MNTQTTCACACGQPTTTTPSGVQRRYVRGHNRRGVGIGWIEGGYRYICVRGKKIAEHRQVVEQREGRKLTSSEVVHHVDGSPLNNDPDNLVILSRAEHQRLHACGRPIRRWTAHEKTRAAELRTAGMTLQQIAKALGRPFSSARRYACTSAE